MNSDHIEPSDWQRPQYSVAKKKAEALHAEALESLRKAQRQMKESTKLFERFQRCVDDGESGTNEHILVECQDAMNYCIMAIAMMEDIRIVE